MRETSLSFFSAPLVEALKSIDIWLRQENVARVIAATARMSELRKSTFPSHVQVTKRPLKGRRVISRNARYFKQTRLLVAQYPEAQMAERAVPVLLCVIRGTAEIRAGDYALQCQPGDFVLIPPMVAKSETSYAVDDKNTCDVLHIYPGRLLGEGLECWIAHSKGTEIHTGAQFGAALCKNGFLAALFDELSHEIIRASGNALVFSLMRSLVLLLLQELNAGRAVTAYSSNSRSPVAKTQDPLKHALAYIDAHFDAALTIESMARETALSATSFKLLFRRGTGHSFHQYLTDVRMDFAEKLLRETDAKVQEIAQRAGLSQSRFNRIFHARHDCSPGEYRKKK